MSLGYKNTSIVGGPINDTVNTLLEKRQSILEKTADRTNEELLYLNANTAWIKLSSAVNTQALEPNSKGDSTLAKDYILLGGTLYDNALRGGLLPDTEDGRGAYEESKAYGYVPMPGITGFAVTSLNYQGVLRGATVEFKANSIEQLSDLESLFLRPGFSILLEWGHSLYLDTTSENTKVVNNIKTVGDDFFNFDNKEAVVEKIKELRDTSTFNYEAIFGVIKNFTWSYAKNGEYDCKIDIISKGDIAESLRLAVFGNNTDKDDEDINDITQNSTGLHNFISSLVNKKVITINDYIDKNPNLRAAFNQDFITVKDSLEKKNREFKAFKVKVNNLEDNSNDFFTYVPMYVLLEAINSFLMLKPVNSFYIGDKETVNKTPFTTFKQHFIVDPKVGFLPKSENSTKYGYSFATEGKDLGNKDDILNICVNTSYILDTLDNRLSNENITEQNVFDFVKDILIGIQNSSGQINDFDLHYDEESFLYFIVDRKLTPNAPLPELKVQGLGSTVQDFSISSKITNRIASQVAIAAQASNTDAGQEMLNMQNWNKGLVDRFLLEKYYQNKKEPDTTKIFQILTVVQSTYNTETETINYIAEDFQGVRPLFNKLMEKFLHFDLVDKESNPTGIIPVELSLKLTGLGGLKIGEAFTVPSVLLPKKYLDEEGKSRVGWIITKLDHSIDQNRWVTDIGCYMFMLEKTDKIVSQPEDIEEAIEAVSDYRYDAAKIPEEEKLPLEFPLPSRQIRNDSAGGGHFVSPRDGGRRKHRGTDFVASVGTPVTAPIDGTVTPGVSSKTGLPYIIITGIDDYKDYTITLNYVESTVLPSVSVLASRIVKKGTTIGKVIDLGKGYEDARTGKMLNHLDVKFDYKGKRVDPEVEFN
jgi:hypothetical protein